MTNSINLTTVSILKDYEKQNIKEYLSSFTSIENQFPSKLNNFKLTNIDCFENTTSKNLINSVIQLLINALNDDKQAQQAYLKLEDNFTFDDLQITLFEIIELNKLIVKSINNEISKPDVKAELKKCDYDLNLFISILEHIKQHKIY